MCLIYSAIEEVWGFGKIFEECRRELICTIEGWIVLGLRMGQSIPFIDGHTIDGSAGQTPIAEYSCKTIEIGSHLSPRHQNYRHLGVLSHLLGNASEQKPIHSALSHTSHHQKIDLNLLGVPEQFVAWVAS